MEIGIKILKVLGKSVGLCKTIGEGDGLYVSFMHGKSSENFNPVRLVLSEI